MFKEWRKTNELIELNRNDWIKVGGGADTLRRGQLLRHSGANLAAIEGRAAIAGRPRRADREHGVRVVDVVQLGRARGSPRGHWWDRLLRHRVPGGGALVPLELPRVQADTHRGVQHGLLLAARFKSR